MIVKALQITSGFKGRVNYVLRPDDGGRVLFTDTQVLLSTGREVAAEMAETAFLAPRLKKLAGVRAGGKPSKEWCRHDVLSWPKDEQPSINEMKAAARDFLRHMGMAEHEALIAGHTDTDCYHVHIISNRVNPHNGRLVSKTDDHERMQQWAAAYEQKHGKVHCLNRGKNLGEKAVSRAEWQQRRAVNQNLKKVWRESGAAQAWRDTWKDVAPTFAQHKRERKWLTARKRYWVKGYESTTITMHVSRKGHVYYKTRRRWVKGYMAVTKGPSGFERYAWARENAERFINAGMKRPSLMVCVLGIGFRDSMAKLHEAEKAAATTSRQAKVTMMMKAWFEQSRPPVTQSPVVTTVDDFDPATYQSAADEIVPVASKKPLKAFGRSTPPAHPAKPLRHLHMQKPRL